MAEKYVLRVTAGPSYDAATHIEVPVNTENAVPITNEHCTASLQVRVQNYRGLPRSSPSSSPYFSHAPHTHDQYSIAFSFVPHAGVSSTDLVFGNDFDRPIRDRLPPGFGTAFKIVKWAIDPGLDGDVYADKPYLYGPALGSLNVVRVGEKADREGDGGYKLGVAGEAREKGIEEGADGEGEEWRAGTGAPDGAAGRKKWAYYRENRNKWEWEAGRLYWCDFFNQYLDFNEFTLKLPGFSLGILGYMDGADNLRRNHDLRYVLKDKETGNVFFVVVFTLHLKEDIEKEEAEADRNKDGGGNGDNKSKGGGSSGGAPGMQTSSDDVD